MDKHFFEKENFKEISIELEDGQSLLVLINGNFGWLMYLRYEGDAGFSSRNPLFEGDQEEMMEFLLCNGQADFYPLSWVLPIDQIDKAIAYFEETKQQPPFICWHADGV